MDSLTIVIVSFFSKHHVLRICKQLKNYKIIIIENSNDRSLLKILKKKKNIKIFFPKKNLGYGKGNNFGISKIKSKNALILNPDTEIDKKNINNLIKASNNIKDFGIIFPRLDNLKTKKIFKKKQDLIEIDYKFVGNDIVSGCGMLININVIKKIGFFDKNIFLYKEETDLIKRCSENQIKCYVLKNSKINHFGSKSHNKKINLEAEIFRNWHWMWSNFYFYKKHFGFFYALLKFLKKIISSFIKMHIYYYFNQKKSKLYQARFNGIISSMLNKTSDYRIKF